MSPKPALCRDTVFSAEVMIVDPETLAQMNGQYFCPPDAGPAWRAAMAAGIDMSLIEYALTLSPEQRLAEHQQVINFLLTLKGAGLSDAE